MRSTFLTLSVIGFVSLLTGCNGPWNMAVPDSEPRPVLPWVSAMLVADQPFDTIWIERPTPFGTERDPTRSFVDTASSHVAVVRLDGSDTIVYRLVPGSAIAWIPVDPAVRVAAGATYRLEASLRWDASRTWPRAPAFRTTTLRATTTLPRFFSLVPTFLAPLEALDTVLASGLDPARIARARTSPEAARVLLDSIDIRGRLRARGLTEPLWTAWLNGIPVQLPVRTKGDTVAYISDGSPVIDHLGAGIRRYSLQHRVTQIIDRDRWGGVVTWQRFSDTSEKFVTPILLAILESTNSELDTADFHSRGTVRPMMVLPGFLPGTPGWPDTIMVSNLFFGFTGRNVIVFQSVDPVYPEYYTSLTSPNPGFERFTNVEGGDGYFTGSVSDSIDVWVQGTGPRVPVRATFRAWCEDQFMNEVASGFRTSAARDSVWRLRRPPDCPADTTAFVPSPNPT